MKKSDEMIKKMRLSQIRLEAIQDLENLITKYERTRHEIPCDVSPELLALVQARYDAKIALLKKLIEVAEICDFDLPELYLK